MLSVTSDNSGSPKKRTFSRGISEDESLRSIIKESESSSRRLTRSDSRPGTLKRRSGSQQSDQEIFMGLPEMLELQASYDEVVQELRGMEVERETLLFQVDVLQDTLEGVEELLAEAQREAGQASLELEREREAKRKLESMVGSLAQEVERLKEEGNAKPCVPVSTPERVKEEMSQGHQMRNESHSSESSYSRALSEDEGSVPTKGLRLVSKPVGHMPSLALENQVSVDGVHRRPYNNGTDGRRDPSPDKSDSDNISNYEDASADTPEQDRMFPGDADPLELPNDEGSGTSNGSADDNEPQDPKADSCVVS